MNTRSRTRIQARDALNQERMGIKFVERTKADRFGLLKKREIRSTKWACPTMINQLGITNDFNLLCNRVGLFPFVFQDQPTYRRLTLEFLSTLEHTVRNYGDGEQEEGSDMITFHLMNKEYKLTLTQWCDHFGFVNNNSHIRVNSILVKPTTSYLFNKMSTQHDFPKGNVIECPAVRYLYYVIANTLQARGEFTRVNEEDILVLSKAAIPDCNVTPNLGAILVLYLKHQALQTRGVIACGGVITVLAKALHVNISSLMPLIGERRVGFSTLNACGMVSKRKGRYFVHIPGAGRLYPTPLPNDLFSLENGVLHYDAQVEQHQPSVEVPEKEDVVKPRREGPEQEEQPHYTTFQDLYALSGKIENMHNIANILA